MNFTTNGTKLTAQFTGRTVTSDDFFSASFSLDGTWQYFLVRAHLHNGSTSYDLPIENGVISSENFIPLSDGPWDLCLKGEKEDTGSQRTYLESSHCRFTILDDCPEYDSSIQDLTVPANPRQVERWAQEALDTANRVEQVLRIGGFRGQKGEKGDSGTNGTNGTNGSDGFSPVIAITEITGGHRVTITDATGAHTFDVMDGDESVFVWNSGVSFADTAAAYDAGKMVVRNDEKGFFVCKGGFYLGSWVYLTFVGTLNYNPGLIVPGEVTGTFPATIQFNSDGTWGQPVAISCVPEEHASSHAANGSDPITPASIGAVATSAYNPTAKTSAMTQAVGKDSDGTLWTSPGGGTWGSITGTLSNQTDLNNSLSAKYEKPSGGIPSSDMAAAVQTSLGKADSALQTHQDISGKENTSNKVTSLSSSSTDTQYPSAKCVYDLVGSIESALAALR